ncbi:MAG: hypothetical protein CSYNP_02072 [Syntrophus sp. SKADARSKE-3]|nr:hypothetical protein [Syntrophus sp. SKADARSKE-3]
MQLWKGNKRLLVPIIVIWCLIIPMVPYQSMAGLMVVDDANVLDTKAAAFDTLIRRDGEHLHNVTQLSLGLLNNLEIAIAFGSGFFLEGENSWKYSLAGPSGQVKYRLMEGKPNGLPGVAVVAGVVTPYGTNGFGNPSWGDYAYLTLTESLGEKDRVLIHGNIGITYMKPDDYWRYATTWVVGTEVRLFSGLHYLGEIYHGDPIGGDYGGAFQTGLRYCFNEKIQVDVTGGTGLWGDKKPSTFFGIGLRWEFGPLW